MTTILLVEDDPLQAFVRMSVLEKRFPDVRRVADAAEALCLIEQHVFSDNLGLVIAGHHLPGLGGPEFVAELHARKPGLPVLVLGDSQETAKDYAGDCVRFLAKPVGANEIISAASQLLTQNGHKVA
ncbi:MAG: response regulator [Terracidiphilus sp.]|jgi:CheY-like chemotaxis protein